jgi:drug/metabolite transporter (DMT)-like permease
VEAEAKWTKAFCFFFSKNKTFLANRRHRAPYINSVISMTRDTSLDAPDRTGLAPVAAYAAICLIWGSTFYAVRVAVETIPPWTMMGTRSFIAGAVLCLVARLGGARLPDRVGLASALSSGALMFLFGHGLLAWAEIRVPSGAAAVLGCTVSLFTPLAAWMVGAALRPSLLAAAGLLLGFAGVTILADPQSGHLDTLACLALVLSNLGWAMGAAIARRWRPSGSALLASGLQLLAGSAACLVAGWLRGEWAPDMLAHVSTRSVCGLAYLVTFGSLVAFASYGWLMQVWKPERVSTYAYVNPVVALAIGVWFAGEHFGMRELGATVLILGAVALVMLGPAFGRLKSKAFFFEKRTKKLLRV